jgi:hypothetical protein
LLEKSGVGVDRVEFILEMLGEDEGKAWGWSSPRSPARKKCSRWWRSSSVLCSADPSMNSNEDVVDVGLDGFLLHGLVGEKATEGRGDFYVGESSTGGGGAG